MVPQDLVSAPPGHIPSLHPSTLSSYHGWHITHHVESHHLPTSLAYNTLLVFPVLFDWTSLVLLACMLVHGHVFLMAITHVLAIKVAKMVWACHAPLVMSAWHTFRNPNFKGASHRVVTDNNSGALIFSTLQYVVIRLSSTWVVVMLPLGKIGHTFVA